MGHWYNEAVFYHIYPLGLLGAPKKNEGTEIEHRMKKLLPWIDHMKDLGVTAVYIGPLFESTTHGYDTKDYKKVDRRLGDNEDFKDFVKKCHEAGIRVVVDGVFNHTGREFFAFQDIQKNRDYLFDVIHFWIQEFDIDGIRLDCADCLTFDFMKEMRWRTSQEKEDFWLMGEVIHGDYARWANDDVLHSVTNYELHKGLYSGHNDHNYFEIAHTIRREFDENGGIYKGRTLYSFADNHDVDRLASKLNNKAHMFPEYTLLYTLPGIPSIYYGSEWGIEGRKEGGNDDPLRPALNLAEMEEKYKDCQLTEHIRMLGRLKKELSPLSEGKYRELLLTNRQYAFARIQDDKAVIVAVNNDENPAHVSIPVPAGGNAVNAVTGEPVNVENGRINAELSPAGSLIVSVNI